MLASIKVIFTALSLMEVTRGSFSGLSAVAFLDSSYGRIKVGEILTDQYFAYADHGMREPIIK